MKKYFTKSMFKKAMFCPTSMYYHSKPTEYINVDIIDDFTKSLMEGGYQVEFLAKDYFPEGINLKEYSTEANIIKTQELISQNEIVTLFEPCFIFNDFLIRIDILVKKGNNLIINEVKAKSFNFLNNVNTILTNTFSGKALKSEWREYVMDVAFQKYVLSSAMPNMNVISNLFLLDTSKYATVEGLHQKYLVRYDNSVEIQDMSIGEPIMKEFPLDIIFKLIGIFSEKSNFITQINHLKENYLNETKIITSIGNKCKDCPFYTKDETDTHKSGFLECWSLQSGLNKNDLKNKPTILDLWNFRYKDALITNNTYLLEQISKNKFTYDHTSNIKLKYTVEDRQHIQVKCAKENITDIHVHDMTLREIMKSWKFPLNMIDFETIAPAIPFNIEMKPYEAIAFQFSHHVIHSDGRVEHKAQYLNTERGKFPSFDFVRALKTSLESNNGSVFMYSSHENSILNHILLQLYSFKGVDIPDRFELINFIKTITITSTSVRDKLPQYINSWIGERAMIDMWDILKKTYYNPLTNGSNSIKHVLPAILNSSEYLKNKYTNPIYGTDQMTSHNYNNHVWINEVDGKVVNPYKLLPKLFDGDLDGLMESEGIANGGDAMIAYAKMQYVQLTEQEKDKIIKGLLMYCELDTLAMVMLFEHWYYDILEAKLTL